MLFIWFFSEMLNYKSFLAYPLELFIFIEIKAAHNI